MNARWPQATIGSLFEIGAGKSVTPASRQGEPKRPFLRTSNVFWGRIDLTDVDRMFFHDLEFAQKALRDGDLLVCEGGDIGRAAIWRAQLPECGFQNHLHRLRASRPDICVEFMRYALEAGVRLFGLIDGVGNRTTIPNLSRNSLASLTLPHPPLGEQKAIAAILAAVEAAVEAEGDLLRTARELKQAALAEVFDDAPSRGSAGAGSSRLRPSGWQYVPIESVAAVLNSSLSYTQLFTITEFTVSDGVEVMGVKVSDMNLSGNETEFTSANLRRYLPSEVAKRTTVPPNSVVFPKRGAAIGTNKKRMTTTWTVLDPNLIAVRAGDALDPWFLYRWFEHFDLRKITEPGPTPQLNKKNLTPLMIPVCSMEHQTRLSAIFRALDARIARHEARRRVLRELFASLLHDLMSGRRRVAKGAR